jgi:hypothetical protein
MKKLITLACAILMLTGSWAAPARDDDFGDVVKLVERFYHVKHKGLPFLARAGMKTATTVAKLAGGPKQQLAEAGSVKVAWFEDQDFTASGNFVQFKSTMNSALAASWSPLVQVASQDEQQTHIYLREAGQKFQVLVVTIEPREACVVQVTLSPENLAKLMRNPDDMGKSITADATTEDNQ